VQPDAVSSKANSFKRKGYEIIDADAVWRSLPESSLVIDRESQKGQQLAKVFSQLDVDDITGIYSNATLV